jgi:PAS domain S-box-containing protein
MLDSLRAFAVRWIPARMLQPRMNPLAVTLLVLFVLLGIWWEGGRWLAGDLRKDERRSVAARLATRADALELAVNRQLSLLESYRAFVESQIESHNGTLPEREFGSFAAGLRAGSSTAASFVVVPASTGKHFYPSTADPDAGPRHLGHDTDPILRRAAERAAQTGAVVLSGPFRSPDGKLVLVARVAAFRGDRVWGIICLAVELQLLLESVGLEPAPPDLSVVLTTAGGEAFHGQPSIARENPVEDRVALPGDFWRVAAAPRAGWGAGSKGTRQLYTVLGLVIVGLLVTLTYAASSRQSYLSAAVRRRTSELEREVAERTHTEQDLRLSQAHFSSIVQLSEDAIISFDREQRILLFNRGAEKLFGRREAEALGQPLDILLPERLVQAHRGHVEKFLKSPETIRSVAVRQPITGRRADGSEFPAEGDISKFEVGGQLVLTIRLREITERLRSEEALRRLAAIVESSEDAIFSRTLDGAVLSWNLGAERLFGYTAQELKGRSVELLVPPERRAEVQAVLDRLRRGESVATLDTVRLRKDGTRVPVSLRMSPIRNAAGGIAALSVIARDITEQKRLEARIRQSQKMEAIGTLAGGVAHDFNNVLSVIIGYTEMALDAVDANGPARDDLKQALVAARRAKDLVHQILVFSRHREQERTPLELHQVVREGMHLVRASLPATIEIRQDVDTRSGLVLADATQMHQVLMNLCANAEHAMRKRGGLLEVSLRPVLLDAAFTAAHSPLEPGPYLRLRVRDTGHGMTAEVRERIFDPFFTTKAGGEGTGMGLAVVHGIVAAHGGAISVDSAPDQGATFEIYLPAWAGRPAGEAQGPGDAQGGRESILLVDDEEPLVALWTRRLRGLGYRVTGCTSGVDALRTFRAAPHAFDVVITDQTMPHLTGDSLAVEMLRVRADIPIILCTGYSHTITEERAAALGIRAFLLKPCTMEEMATAIRGVLRTPALS